MYVEVMDGLLKPSTNGDGHEPDDKNGRDATDARDGPRSGPYGSATNGDEQEKDNKNARVADPPHEGAEKKLPFICGRDGRGPDGRFSRGNYGGPGNPHARTVAALKEVLLDLATPEVIQVIGQKLIILAFEGNVSAARLILSYTLGKPSPMPAEPDRLDQHEWQIYEAEAQMFARYGDVSAKPGGEIPIMLARGTKPLTTERQRDLYNGIFSLSPNDYAKVLREGRTMSDKDLMNLINKNKKKNAAKGAKAPSANGTNGAMRTNDISISNGKPKSPPGGPPLGV